MATQQVTGPGTRHESPKPVQVQQESPEIVLKKQVDDYRSSLARMQADFDNFRKIMDKEKKTMVERTEMSIFRELLVHRDDLQRAARVLAADGVPEAVQKGYDMIVENFDRLLQAHGVRPMNCTGQEMDPFKHEAILVETDPSVGENTILAEIEPGYYYHDKVLRPARVKVAKQPDPGIVTLVPARDEQEIETDVVGDDLPMENDDHADQINQTNQYEHQNVEHELENENQNKR